MTSPAIAKAMRELEQAISSALAAAEKRGAEREREVNSSLWPCAPNSKDPDDDKEWLAGFVAGVNAFRSAIRARSQPDER